VAVEVVAEVVAVGPADAGAVAGTVETRRTRAAAYAIRGQGLDLIDAPFSYRDVVRRDLLVLATRGFG